MLGTRPFLDDRMGGMNIFNTIAGFVVGVVVSGLSVVGIQTPLTPPTLTLTADPVAIHADRSSTIEWSSTGADECTSTQLDTGGDTSGKTSVSPTKTTTYTITCSKAPKPAGDTGAWKYSFTDYTDLWCTSHQPSFKNFYTENECPSENPEGQSCGALSDTCAVNNWQTKGGTFGDIGSKQYCNLVSRIYRCVPSTGAASAPAASGTGTKTVYSGEFGNLVAPHLQYRAILQKDINQNGGPFVMDGLYDDKATADRVCSVLFPGSSNVSYKNDKYSSPKNNTVLRWDGTRWTQQSAKNHNRHLRFAFTCVAPAEPKPADPPQQPLKVTKSVTVIILGEEPDGDPDTDPDTGPDGGGGPGGGDGGGDNGDREGRGALQAQCTDGIDNNGNGLVDLEDTYACSSSDDSDEEPLPEAVLSFSAQSLVKVNTSVELSWSAENVRSGSCSIHGSNGDAWSLSGTSGKQLSSPLAGETVFTLSCIDLNGDRTSTATTVKILPSFGEI